MKPILPEITDKWIKEFKPCQEAVEWWNKEPDPIKILKKLIKDKKYDWANWFIVRVMEKKDYVSYGVYAAKQVTHLWKDKYPEEYKIWKDWVDKGCSQAKAAEAVARAVWAAEATMQLKILKYGMKLLREKK